jgi:signal peptidase
LAKRSFSKGVIKDIAIVGVGVLVIWFGLTLAFGTQNPFYVVASGSMIPELEVYDVLVVQGHEPFEDLEIGDIIVFNRPSDHNRVIVHRVVSITDDDPITLRTKGDANPASIPGTDFPITEEEYIGKVVYTLPQVGYVTQLLKPPINYVIIVVVIGVMVVKQITKRKKEKKITFLEQLDSEQLDSENQDTVKEFSDIDKIEKDSEYSEHVEKSEIIQDRKINSDETTKTDEKTPEKDKEE